MAIWTPEATWVGPSPNQSGKMLEQRGMILHVMQGSLAGSIQWGKNPDSDVSFHFGTRKSDGLVLQLVDTDITAWTQCAGNGRWVSVENEDYSGNPLSDAQVESIARLYARGVREYGWPLQITDDPNGRGLGWHGMGGVAWCNHPQCPGEPIKAQRPAILARAQQILTGDGDMGLMDDPDFAANAYRTLALIEDAPTVIGGPTKGEENKLHNRLNEIEAKLDAIVAGMGDITVVITEAQIASAVRKELDKTKLTGA